MAIVLRTATRDDRDAIVTVFLACWRQSYAGILPESAITAMTDERASALWSRVLAEAAGAVLVAERDGTVLGVTRFADAVVHSLYVSPDAQGLGVGTRLLDAAVESLRAGGARSVALWVFAANAPSIAFYEARGWQPDGQTRTQDEFGELELRLRRDAGGAG
ncbi:MAG TPA: GNAT family N-acetyltransferase [Agromyces sp.]|nr:GNAT family N-acetyltransferase [Agromyces sp.]